MMTMTRTNECTAPAGTATLNLLLAFELGDRVWKIGFTTGMGQRPRIRQVAAGAIDRVREEIARARVRLKLAATTPVVSCYEAGRDGFWLHRWLVAEGITNYVMDSSSIEVNRRARRAKTDRLDLAGLLNLLARYVVGDRRVSRVVRVPSVADEDARQLHRTWESLQQDRSRLPPHAGTEPRDNDRPLCRRTADAPRNRLNWWLGVSDRDLWLAADPEPAAAKCLSGVGARALSERRDGSRPGHYACRQQTCPPPHGATRVELGALSTGERVDAVVSTALWQREQTDAPHRNYRAGSKAADCALALCRTG
jgi:hypothetical protein